MHLTGTKHIVRHLQKFVVQWSVISKFTCIVNFGHLVSRSWLRPWSDLIIILTFTSLCFIRYLCCFTESDLEIMGSRILCGDLTELLKRTITSFCEINVDFNNDLEILGSIHIRADRKEVSSPTHSYVQPHPWFNICQNSYQSRRASSPSFVLPYQKLH